MYKELTFLEKRYYKDADGVIHQDTLTERSCDAPLTEAFKTYVNKGKDKQRIKDNKRQRALKQKQKIESSICSRIDSVAKGKERAERNKRFKALYKK